VTSSWSVLRLALSAAVSAMARKRVLSCLWELTYRCNARCAICPHWRKHGAAGDELTTPEIQAGLALLERHGLRAVNFTGGEPLFREDLEAVIEEASRRGIWTSIVTNGSLLTRDRLAALKDAGLDNLLVSLDSPNPAVHDGHRGIPGLHHKVLTVLLWMRDMFLSGHRTGGIMCAIARHNAGEIEMMLALARRHGVYLVLQPYHPNKTGDFSLAATLPPDTIASIRSETRHGGVLLNSAGYAEGLLSYRPGRKGAVCAAGRKYFSVDPYGFIHPCVDMPAAGHLIRDGLACLSRPGAGEQVSRCQGCWYCFRGEADCTLSPAGYFDKARLACRVIGANRARRARAIQAPA